MDVLVHEVFVEGLVDVSALLAELDVLVEAESLLVVWALEERTDQFGRVVVVLGDVVDIDSSTHVDDEVEGEVEAIVEFSPVSEPVLVGRVHDDVLNGGSFLVVDESKVVGVLSSLGEDEVRMGEAIADADSLQPRQKSLLLLLSLDLLSNSRSVLPSVTLSEHEQRLIPSDSHLLEASIRLGVELRERIVKIIGDFFHILAVWTGMRWIGVAHAGSNGLINEDYIVLFDPGVVILHDFVGRHGGGSDEMRPELHEVAELTGGAWSAVQPDDGGVILECIPRCALPAVEDEPQG